MSIEEHFGDIGGQTRLHNDGIFSGSAVDDFGKVHVEHSPDGTGVRCKMFCQNCGQPAFVAITWLELIHCMMGLKAPNWDDGEGMLWPLDRRCMQCNRPHTPMVTPDECARYLKAGIAARRITEPQVQQAAQQIRQMAGMQR